MAIEKARGAEDDINTVAAGTLTGMVFKSAGGCLNFPVHAEPPHVCFLYSQLVPTVSPGGLKGVARGGLVGLALSGAYALYNNWDHITGSSSSPRLY